MISRFIVFTTIFFSNAILSADFGVGNWGDSRDTILSEETRINVTPIGQFDYLVYDTSFGNIKKIKLVYRFQQGVLHRGVFIFSSEAMEAGAMVNQYTMVKQLISEKYGTPTEDHAVWSTATLSDDQSLWPEYLMNNQLILQSEWQSNTTTLFHQLSENNGMLHHQLVYQPLNQVVNSTETESLF